MSDEKQGYEALNEADAASVDRAREKYSDWDETIAAAPWDDDTKAKVITYEGDDVGEFAYQLAKHSSDPLADEPFTAASIEDFPADAVTTSDGDESALLSLEDVIPE